MVELPFGSSTPRVHHAAQGHQVEKRVESGEEEKCRTRHQGDNTF